jgi:hypothetical protein
VVGVIRKHDQPRARQPGCGTTMAPSGLPLPCEAASARRGRQGKTACPRRRSGTRSVLAGRLTLAPIRSNQRAELAALTAPHPRAEGEDREVVGPCVDVDVDFGIVDAVLAGHEEPMHAVAAHVAEGHGVGWGGASSLAIPEAKNRQETKPRQFPPHRTGSGPRPVLP